MKPKVYFSPTITPEKVVELYQLLDKDLPGNVAIKLHSGEKGNQNFIRPEFWKRIVEHEGGTVVETNTAYPGARNKTKRHERLLDYHGWSRYYRVDLLDAQGPDIELGIPNGKVIEKTYIGKDTANYDSMLVLSHFKGHPMGGYGGALKQLGIGMQSSHGKAYVHGAGHPIQMWTQKQDLFLESMADAAGAVIEFFKGNILYINVLKNISVDCDCLFNAKPPCMADIGIMASADPVAIDQACLDMVYSSSDPGRDQLIARIEKKHGVHTVEAAAALGYGSREYALIQVE